MDIIIKVDMVIIMDIIMDIVMDMDTIIMHS